VVEEEPLPVVFYDRPQAAAYAINIRRWVFYRFLPPPGLHVLDEVENILYVVNIKAY
jgi:hypothetical protein